MAIEGNEGSGPSEDALFDNAISPAPEPPAPAPAEKAPAERAAPEPREQSLPEGGEKHPAVDDDAPMVPSWRVREINEEKRAAQAERDAFKAERDRFAYEQQEFRRRLQQLETPEAQPTKPDPLLDPQGYQEFLERRFDERLLNERREYSLQMARKHYKQDFDQAYALAQKYVDPALRARMQQSSDPGETLMQWFAEVKERAEVGGDIVAYKKRIRDEALKDPEFRKAAMEAWQGEAPTTDASGRPHVRLAPSLNGISRSNAALRAELQSDQTDEALFDNVTGPRRR